MLKRSRGWLAPAAAMLAIASIAALAALPAPEIMSLDRTALNVFVQPGVMAWWLILAGPCQFAPTTLAGYAAIVAANAACWCLGLWFVIALARETVTRSWYLIAAPGLTVASLAIVAMRESNRMVPSIVRNPLVAFVGPGVAVWWSAMGNLFQGSPSSRGGMLFAAVANAGFWLMAFRLLVAALGFLRRKLRNPRA